MTLVSKDISGSPELAERAGEEASPPPVAAQRAADASDADSQDVTYSRSAGLFERLAKLDLALAFTSYQSGFLYMLGCSRERGPQLHQSAIAKPMGLWLDGSELVVAGDSSITCYRDVLRPDEQVNDTFDACYVPRTTHMTGRLDVHDLARDADGRIVFVNTRYNCLATLSSTHSFAPLWRPPFISSLVDEDRCHLNGLAMRDGRPAFVTAVSRSDTIDGWRDRRADGGVVIDVASNEIVCSGLSMPHSPRWHRDKLWLLNAGTGELGTVGDDGRFDARVFCPGFGRGLAFHGNYAFIGLSKPRHQRFEGLALEQRLEAADSEPWCGIQVIDLDRGTCVEWFRIDGAVSEIYDVALFAGKRCPMAISPDSADAASFVTFIDQPPA